jgi:hypothetical protein
MKGLYHLWIGQAKLMEALNLGKLQHLGQHEFEFAPFSTFSPLKLEVFLSFFQHQ